MALNTEGMNPYDNAQTNKAAVRPPYPESVRLTTEPAPPKASPQPEPAPEAPIAKIEVAPAREAPSSEDLIHGVVIVGLAIPFGNLVRSLIALFFAGVIAGLGVLLILWGWTSIFGVPHLFR
jgi:hypothetical protein